jgi:hypothetical protein
MENTRSLIGQLGSHLAMRSGGREGGEAMIRFRAAGIDVGPSTTPVELALRCHGTGSVERSRSIVAGLLSLAPHDELAALTGLVALGPGLANLASRLVAKGWDRAEAESVVVAYAFEAVTGPRPREPVEEGPAGMGLAGTASQVVARTRSLAHGEDRRRGRRQRREVRWAHNYDAEGPGADPAERVTTVLFDAVASGVITDDQALLVGATRGHDIAVGEVARFLHSSPAALRQSRRRAERALAGFLRDQEMGR